MVNPIFEEGSAVLDREQMAKLEVISKTFDYLVEFLEITPGDDLDVVADILMRDVDRLVLTQDVVNRYVNELHQMLDHVRDVCAGLESIQKDDSVFVVKAYREGLRSALNAFNRLYSEVVDG